MPRHRFDAFIFIFLKHILNKVFCEKIPPGEPRDFGIVHTVDCIREE